MRLSDNHIYSIAYDLSKQYSIDMDVNNIILSNKTYKFIKHSEKNIVNVKKYFPFTEYITYNIYGYLSRYKFYFTNDNLNRTPDNIEEDSTYVQQDGQMVFVPNNQNNKIYIGTDNMHEAPHTDTFNSWLFNNICFNALIITIVDHNLNPSKYIDIVFKLYRKMYKNISDEVTRYIFYTFLIQIIDGQELYKYTIHDKFVNNILSIENIKFEKT